jgi:hypothetical protein
MKGKEKTYYLQEQFEKMGCYARNNEKKKVTQNASKLIK